MCQCPAGAGSKCKHIAALIIFVNSEEGTSKTDEPQQWGRPAKYCESLYKKGKKILDLFPQKQLNNDIPILSHNDFIQNHNILSLPCSLSYNLCSEQLSEVDRQCSNILNNIIDNIEQSLKYESNNDFLSNIIIKQVQSDLPKFYSAFPLTLTEHTYFYEKIYVNEAMIKSIFNQTLHQSLNLSWNQNRKIRISASLKAHKIKTLRNKSEQCQNKLAISLLNETTIVGKGASNIQYGLQTEDKAFNAFCDMYNIDVIKSGLVVHICRPWISASPDGLILKNGKISSVLEIKCPSSCKQKSIIDQLTGKSNLSYIEIKNGEVGLKYSHIYYTQIQMLLYCTGLNDCHLFIFNEIKPLLLIIKRDLTFLENIIPKLDKFYFSFYLPNLCNQSNKL